jgi:hypothetical protein
MMWKKVVDELPEPDEDILFTDVNIFFKCPHTGLPIKSSAIYGYRDKHRGGHFRSYTDGTDIFRPTHWCYVSDIVDLIKTSE